MSNYVVEVSAGRKTRPIRHLYEAFFYVLVGNGSTTVWLPNGETRSFEWGPRALFAIPLNCQYQIFNNSGLEPARLSCTHDGPITINLYHNLISFSTIHLPSLTEPACQNILKVRATIGPTRLR